MARAFCLILVPVLVYMAIFEVHFLALRNNGPGSSSFSAEFQSSLRGGDIPDTFADVAYGSKITIRHAGTSGGYLHSHKHTYPSGSKQQQVTCYPFRGKWDPLINVRCQQRLFIKAAVGL
jgi:dolichyl-phosphate-mannose-protein mannosyltransferase